MLLPAQRKHSADYVGGRYEKKGVPATLATATTVSRTSGANAPRGALPLVAFAADAPRVVPGSGLLLERPTTNLLPNVINTGAVVGVDPSVTYPTGTEGTTSGVKLDVVAVGSSNGTPFITYKLYRTTGTPLDQTPGVRFAAWPGILVPALTRGGICFQAMVQVVSKSASCTGLYLFIQEFTPAVVSVPPAYTGPVVNPSTPTLITGWKTGVTGNYWIPELRVGGLATNATNFDITFTIWARQAEDASSANDNTSWINGSRTTETARLPVDNGSYRTYLRWQTAGNVLSTLTAAGGTGLAIVGAGASDHLMRVDAYPSNITSLLETQIVGTFGGGVIVTPTSALTRSGANIMYNGQVVRLRGVNFAEVLAYRTNKGRTTADYTTIATGWNCNAVRIDVNTPTWRDKSGTTVETALDREIKAALAAGLFPIVNFHPIGWPDGYNDAPGWNSVESWVADSFWNYMATKYGKDGRIVFELWNEPMSNAAPWNDPAGASWNVMKGWHNRWIAAIRGLGGIGLIICASDSKAGDLRGIPNNHVTDPLNNYGYVQHTYPPTAADGGGLDFLGTGALCATHPVLITECGYVTSPTTAWDYDAGSWHTNMMTYYNSKGLSWQAWSWTDNAEPTLVGTDWSTPTPSGTYYKAQLVAIGTQIRP